MLPPRYDSDGSFAGSGGDQLMPTLREKAMLLAWRGKPKNQFEASGKRKRRMKKQSSSWHPRKVAGFQAAGWISMQINNHLNIPNDCQNICISDTQVWAEIDLSSQWLAGTIWGREESRKALNFSLLVLQDWRKRTQQKGQYFRNFTNCVALYQASKLVLTWLGEKKEHERRTPLWVLENALNTARIKH